jgi:hypothetical protein
LEEAVSAPRSQPAKNTAVTAAATTAIMVFIVNLHEFEIPCYCKLRARQESPPRAILFSMHYKKASLALALLLPLAALGGERCLAIDGDTLVCNRQKVRLVNVNAAELKRPGGAEAKRRLQALVRGRSVVLKHYGKDRYGRLLAEVYVEGRRIEQADVGPARSRRQ